MSMHESFSIFTNMLAMKDQANIELVGHQMMGFQQRYLKNW